jgi:hypothetical protein
VKLDVSVTMLSQRDTFRCPMILTIEEAAKYKELVYAADYARRFLRAMFEGEEDIYVDADWVRDVLEHLDGALMKR